MDRVFERGIIMSFAIEIVIKAPLDVVCDYIIEDEKIKRMEYVYNRKSLSFKYG